MGLWRWLANEAAAAKWEAGFSSRMASFERTVHPGELGLLDERHRRDQCIRCGHWMGSRRNRERQRCNGCSAYWRGPWDEDAWWG